MKLLRRLIAWLFFLAFLFSVGAGVFHFVRYRPRCTIQARNPVQHVSVDGRWLVTHNPEYPIFFNVQPMNPSEVPEEQRQELLEVWDASTGRRVRSFDVDLPIIKSPDNHLFACGRTAGRVQVVDWRAGQSWTVPLEPRAIRRYCGFSPKGRWLHVTSTDDSSVIIDLEKRQIAHRLPREVSWFEEFIKDDRHVLWMHDRKLHVLELETGAKRSVELELADVQKGVLYARRQSIDGKWLAYEGDGCHEIWDLSTVTRLPKRESLLPKERAYRIGIEFAHARPLFIEWSWSGRETRVAMTKLGDVQRSWLYVFNNDGTKHKRRPSQTKHLIWGHFSDDDSVFLLGQFGMAFPDEQRLAVFETASGKLLWERRGSAAERLSSIYFSKGQLLASDEKNNLFALLDSRTGEEARLLTRDFEVPTAPTAFRAFARDDELVAIRGRHKRSGNAQFWERWLEEKWPAYFATEPPGAIVVEVSSGDRLLSLRHRQPLEGIHISADGGTLVTEHRVTGPEDPSSPLIIEVWEVSSGRAWDWAVLSSLAIGMILVIVRRRHLKHRLAAGPSGSAPA